MSQPLQGQTVLLTGASQGIGEVLARRLAELGMQLALCARNMDKLTALKAQLEADFPQLQCLALPCDVRDPARVEAVTQETLASFGRIDVLINNAGVAPKVGLLQELSIEEIDRTIDTNLKGAIYAMRTVIPVMVQQQAGVIINVNSIAGKTAYPYWSAYDASKFGLHAVTEAVAEEQKHNHIKVVGVYPGAVDTPIWEGLQLAEAPRKAGMLAAGQVADAIAYILQQPANVLIKELIITPLQPAV